MGAANPKTPEPKDSGRGPYAPGLMLRIYLRRLAHQSNRLPAHELIVLEARRRGLAGASALSATMGYGESTKIHEPHILSVEKDLPVIVEIIDEPERIRSFLPVLAKLMSGGIAILQEVELSRRTPTA